MLHPHPDPFPSREREYSWLFARSEKFVPTVKEDAMRRPGGTVIGAEWGTHRFCPVILELHIEAFRRVI